MLFLPNGRPELGPGLGSSDDVIVGAGLLCMLDGPVAPVAPVAPTSPICPCCPDGPGGPKFK